MRVFQGNTRPPSHPWWEWLLAEYESRIEAGDWHGGRPAFTVDPEAHVRALLARGDWEGARLFDLYRAVVQKDSNLAGKLILGTPITEFRERLSEIARSWSRPLPDTVDVLIGPPTQEWLWARSGENSFGLGRFKEGELIQRTLRALTHDFYRHPDRFELWRRIYPEERYRAGSSPRRLHEALRRLRAWFRAGSIPIEIRGPKGRFALISATGCRLRISRGFVESPFSDRATARSENQLRRLRLAFGERFFSSPAAALALCVSQSAATEYLRQACHRGHARRSGTGKTTRYVLLDPAMSTRLAE